MRTCSACAVAGLAVLSVFGAPVVDLTVREDAGIARYGEPVIMGVPLPENGDFSDTAFFTLRDAHNTIIPCDFRRACSWHRNPDRIRWLHLTFPVSLAAGDSAVLTLHSENEAVSPPTAPGVLDSGGGFVVNTGRLRFIVRKSGFNLIDQAWIDETGAQDYSDANKVVLSHGRGVVLKLGDVEYLSSNDTDTSCRVSVEKQTAGMVVIKAMGILTNAAGGKALNYLTRLTAFNNSATIRVQSTVAYQEGDITRYANLAAVSLEVPLNLSQKTALIGAPGDMKSYPLQPGQEAYFHVMRPSGSHPSMGTAMVAQGGGAASGAVAAFDPKTAKPKDIGWAALSDGAKGCVAGMKYFWQLCPASVEATGEGVLRVSPLSGRRSGAPALPFYAGTARTSETRWTFFNHAGADAIRALGVAAVNPLCAFAPPAWYTRKTNAVFPLVEADNGTLFPEAYRPTVDSLQKRIAAVWERVLAFDNMAHFGYDSYGFLEWGDNTHYSGQGPAAPFDALWNGNYYDLPLASFKQFLATGDRRFFDYAAAHAQHVYDVHQCHFGSGSAVTGGNRYCPPSYHIATEDGAPTVGNMSHHKMEGVFLHHYLTGDDYALQVALEAAEYCNGLGFSYAVGPGDNTRTYIRRWAHVMNTVIAAYRHTLDAKYYTQLWQNWEMMKKNIALYAAHPSDPAYAIGMAYQSGLATEVVAKMHDILSPGYPYRGFTPDSIPHYLKLWVDVINGKPAGTTSASMNANNTYGEAFLSRAYGSSYLNKAARMGALLPLYPNNLHKDFVEQGRSIDMAYYYFAIPDSLPAEVDAEKRVKGPERAAALDIRIQPNPFNPATRIRIRGVGVRGAGVSIYDMAGRLVSVLPVSGDGEGVTAVWNAQAAGSGVFVVCCTAGILTCTQKVCYLK